MFHNLIPVTLGNIVGGGLFVGTAYWLISPVRRQKAAGTAAVNEAKAAVHAEA
jgi:nitrite transporter NirC